MIISIIVPDITGVGGTERAVSSLSNLLVAQGHTVTIVSVVERQAEYCYYTLDQKVKIEYLGHRAMSSNPLKKISWSVSLVKILRRYFDRSNPSVIIGTGHNVNWLLPLVRFSKKWAIVACEHIVYSSLPLASRIFMALTYRYIDSIVVLSERAKASYSRYRQVVVIPNSLPFVGVKSTLTSKEILLVGRLSVEKGLERLVPIVRNIRSEFPLWRISLVGDGPARGELERLYKDEGVDDYIVFRGAVKNIAQVYSNSSIYAMTSHFEAFPMVLLEAQSCALPLVAFDCPEGPSQIIHDGEDGFLIENNDTHDFADALMKLMSDLDLRRKFGDQSQLNSQAYSPECVSRRWESLLKTLSD